MIPLLLIGVALGLIFFGQHRWMLLVVISYWGLVFGPAPVAWSTWVTRKVPHMAETGGGIFVAAIQSSAALGALAGGMIFDSVGSTGVFVLSAVCWLGSSYLAFSKVKTF
ncbi:MAG: hypothetical protein R3A11_05970 [Bdellovibrionota bacterium]